MSVRYCCQRTCVVLIIISLRINDYQSSWSFRCVRFQRATIDTYDAGTCLCSPPTSPRRSRGDEHYALMFCFSILVLSPTRVLSLLCYPVVLTCSVLVLDYLVYIFPVVLLFIAKSNRSFAMKSEPCFLVLPLTMDYPCLMLPASVLTLAMDT